MGGDTGGPVLRNVLAAGGVGIGGQRSVWRTAGGSEDEKFPGTITQRPESEGGDEDGALRAGSYGSYTEFDFFAARRKLSLAVTEDFCALQLHPESAFGIGHEALDRADGSGSWAGLLEKLEIQTVEADQTFFGADPEVAVAALRDAGNGASGETALAAPTVANVFGFGAAYIFGVSDLEKTGESYD
jgi:hypothetical protein